MGAFFLYQRTANVLGDRARALFDKKGFEAPNQFLLGRWCLVLYKKMLQGPENSIIDEKQNAVYCIGTFVYKGLAYRESLIKVLRDWERGCLDQRQMLGSYCLIFWNGESISVLLDRARTFHVFCNDKYTLFSSSFLAALEAAPTALPINRLALCEKLSTGYIVAPDTLVKGINQVDEEISRRINAAHQGVVFLPVQRPLNCMWHSKGVDDSMGRQIEQLGSHFRSMNALHCENGGELGMSSGYDSRLVLSCSKYLSKRMAIHTHATKGVHESEADIVRLIAGSCGLELNEERTRSNDDLSAEQLDAMLEDNLYFYDGRCSHNMGSFSQVYTREYKIRSLGQYGLSWNGLGGEIYRNYYFTRDKLIDCRSWMDRHIYYPFAKEAWGDRDEYDAMHERKVRKITRRLGLNEPKKDINFLWTRRYYGEVRMPDCDSVNVQACNQLKFIHAPFFEPQIVAEAICASDYIGCDGAYQARLIHTLSPKLAQFETHYGHNLERIPLQKNVRSYFKGLVPLKWQLTRIKALRARSFPIIADHYCNLLGRSTYGADILSVLENNLFKGDWRTCLIDYAQRPTAISVANFIRAFRHKIIMSSLP